MKILAVLLTLFLTGCANDCSDFGNWKGKVLTHKLTNFKYLVISVSDWKNYEGYCTVTARGTDGRAVILSVDELK